ncbi:MAG: HDOD domain-containing protein [Janthinobacterium lividum]
MKNPYLESLLSRINDIPTLPASVLRVMQMIEDPFCSSSDLAKVIQGDPAMAAKVLKLANSSYYGFRQKISNIPQAVTLLGFATLKNTLLAAAMFDLFRISGTGFDLGALWTHSVTTATAAKLLAKRARYPQSEKAFTAALMHDIGKIILARFIPQALSEIVDTVQTEQMAMYDAEKKILGLSHPALGAWVLGRWGLPSPIVEAVEFHHHPTRAQNAFDLAGVVYLANILAHRSGIGYSGDGMMREIDPMVLEYFSLNEAALVDLQDALVFKRLEIESYAAAAA